MEPNQIKDADILDILFEGRNKDYGAYELRKTYNRRIRKAMLMTGAVVGLMCIGYVVAGRGGGKVHVLKDAGDIVLAEVKIKPDEVLPPPPKPKVTPPPQVATLRVTTVRIVPDNQVKPDEKPPENAQVDDMKIGTANVKGAMDDGIETPPVGPAGTGITEAPKKKVDDDGRFMPVEIEASFPGGTSAWLRFLNKNLQYSSDAQDRGIQGPVMVQFVVDKDGNVSDVEAISGPEEGGLKEEAVRVIRKSGKWTPGVQNGRYVKSYKRQPIVFRLASE